MAVPAVKLEMELGASWVDLTSRLLWSAAPVAITRGMAEGGAPEVGTMTWTLDNSDGELTPLRAASSYYPNIVRGRGVRFSIDEDGDATFTERFTGYVSAEPLSWADEAATDCRISYTAYDGLGKAGSRSLRSVAVEATAARGPIGYWPLTDAESLAAADQSGNGRPSLAVHQQGTGGEASWASGAALPTDNVGGLVLTPESDSGVWLRSDIGIDLPASWSLTVWVSPAAKDGFVCQVGTDAYSIGIWYDTSTAKLSAIETMLNTSGDPVDYVLSTTTATWSGGMETVTVTATTVKLGSSSTTGSRHNSDTMLGSLVAVGGAMAVESGRQRMYSGEVKHLAIWDGALPSGLADDVNTGPAAMFTMSGAIGQVLEWEGLSGASATVTVLGTDLDVALVKTEGLTGLDIIGSFTQGTLARFAFDGAGVPTLVAWDYAPTAVTLPSGAIDPEVEWVGDPDDDVSQVTVTYPDGSQYVTGSTGEGTSRDLPGVLSSAGSRSVAQWLLATASGKPRFADAPYDLLTLPEADAETMAGLDVGSIVTIPDLPAQLPSSSQTSVVDRLTETYGADVWRLQLATSPHVGDQVFIVGDATRGRVSEGYLAAPLGPDSGASSEAWVAGEEVTHTKLNSSAFAGALMQAGSVTITPVANTATGVAVTFDTAYASAPQVVLSAADAAIGSEVKGVSVSGISTTGFTAYVYRTNTTATVLHWLAAI